MKKITTFIKTILMVTAILFAANSTKAVVTMQYDGTTYLCDMNFEGNTIYIENCIGIIGDVDVIGEAGGGGGGNEIGGWTPVSEPSYPTGGGGGGGGGGTSSSTGNPDNSGGTNCDSGFLTWDHYTDSRILTLADCLQDIARDFINYMETAHNIKLRITDAFRSYTDQDAACDTGASKVCGGDSYHNYGLAIDVVEIKNGVALWNNSNWELIGSTGESFGLVWGGRWTNFVDKPHFQLATKSIEQLKNGADPCN